MSTALIRRCATRLATGIVTTAAAATLFTGNTASAGAVSPHDSDWAGAVALARDALAQHAQVPARLLTLDGRDLTASAARPHLYLAYDARIRAGKGLHYARKGWSRRGDTIQWDYADYGDNVHCPNGDWTTIWAHNRNLRTRIVGWTSACYLTSRHP